MNRGFRAKYVRSAVVNDGVCDCCDGTDEHASGACANDCIAAGATARAEAAERMKVIEAGLAKAKEGGGAALAAKAGWQAEVDGLNSGLAEKAAARDSIEVEKKAAEVRSDPPPRPHALAMPSLSAPRADGGACTSPG